MDTSNLLTARDVAALTGRSVTAVNRDAAGESPRLPSVMQYPGKTGPRLFDPAVVADVYGLEGAA